MSLQAQFDKILKKKNVKLNALARDIVEEIKKELKENLRKNWYNSYNPISYNRTYQLMDSITAEIKHSGVCDYTVKVFFDENAIMAVRNDTGWNSHMGFDGESFISGLISSIEHGMKGSHTNPRRGDAAHMIEITQQWANVRARQLLKQRL